MCTRQKSNNVRAKQKNLVHKYNAYIELPPLGGRHLCVQCTRTFFLQLLIIVLYKTMCTVFKNSNINRRFNRVL